MLLEVTTELVRAVRHDVLYEVPGTVVATPSEQDCPTGLADAADAPESCAIQDAMDLTEV